MATEAHRTTDNRDRAGRTLAQTFCLVVGLTLIAVGALGFIESTNFNTGDTIQGNDFIIFEVNGWHNIVHIATGALLLLGAPNGPLAATIATVFGIAYAGVTVWGFIDGNTVAQLIPVNTADNILHAALAGLGLFVGLTSGGLMGASRERETATTTRTA